MVLSVTRALAVKDLAPAYEELASVDFSRDILAYQAKRLLVLRDSGSGWADLGSPDRVMGVLAKRLVSRHGSVEHRVLGPPSARCEKWLERTPIERDG